MSEEELAANWNHGQVWERDGTRYQVVKRMTRKEPLSSGWQVLFQLMEVLAMKFGADGVRLVLWFDPW